MELKKRNIKLALSVVGACFGAGLTVAAGAAVVGLGTGPAMAQDGEVRAAVA